MRWEWCKLSSIKEQVLSVDNFNKPKELLNEKAIATQIMRLILLEKGTLQTHPDMGVGIRSRYRYAESDKMISLKYDIKNQIEQYLPSSYSTVEVNCRLSSHAIIIEITADDTLFRFIYDQSTDVFQLSEI